MTMTRRGATEGKRKAARNVDESMDKLYKSNRRAMDDLARK